MREGELARWLAATAVALLTAAPHGQAMRIPDFRYPPRATLKPGEPRERCGTIQ